MFCLFLFVFERDREREREGDVGEGHLSAKAEITGEKLPVNLACDSDFHVNHRVL
jgi:hypothetical protein